METAQIPTENEISNVSPVAEIEIKASQIVERLEEAVDKATEAIQIVEESDETHPSYKEANLALKGQSWKTNEGFLTIKEKPIPQILSILEDLIVYENVDEDDEGPSIATLSPLSVITKLSLVLQTVAAFSNNLDRNHLNNLHNKIHNETTRWISHLFRFYECNAFYHEEPLEGVVRITRMMLHYRYPKYLEDGFDALKLNPPVIYSSMATSLGIAQHICRQLGLSLSCIKAVPCNVAYGNPQKMDINALETLIAEDIGADRIPLIILADAGTVITGHTDDLLNLQETCKKHNMWLHVRGHCLASLAMANSSTVPKRIGDSMTLQLGTWLGTAGLPTVTLYHQIEPPQQKEGKTVGTARESTLPLIAGLLGDHFQKRLVALPLWFALQAFGREGIQKRIRDSFHISETLWTRLCNYTCLRLMSQKPGGTTGSLTTEQLITKPLTSAALMFEVVASTVVFQFVPVEEPEFSGRVPSYYDKLNSWLGQILQRDIPQVNVELCDVEYAGIVLRICPLETILPITDGDVDAFFACLEQQLEILTATVRLKIVFQDLVEANPNLRLVEMEGWAGLGGVRYVPAVVDDVDSKQWEHDINRLNIDLVNKLRSSDAAFSLGEGKDNLVCVRFGMVTADTDVEDLLNLVTSIGREIEESAKYLDVMVEIVKKGIETATLDLQKENEERLRQEGIIRNVPVFGSLVNWWYPKPKETGVKGRSLNLQAGVVESTENIYRYHMQLQQGAVQAGNKSPPAPLVQTTILYDNTNSTGEHSRTSSHSSQASMKSNEQQKTPMNNDTTPATTVTS